MKVFGPNSVDKDEIKKHYFLKLIVDYPSKIKSITEGNPFFLRYVGLLHTLLTNRPQKAELNLVENLRGIEKIVKSDTMRAYRIRNLLTHQAAVDEVFFDETYEKMSYYLKLVLDDLLFSMKSQPSHSIFQLVYLKKESYDRYKKFIQF